MAWELVNVRYIAGLIDFAAAIVLLIPSLAGIGVLFLAPMMIGAVLTQLLIIGGSQLCQADF